MKTTLVPILVSLAAVLSAAAVASASLMAPPDPQMPPATPQGPSSEGEPCSTCSAPLVDVQPDGDAHASHVAVSGTGDATSKMIAVSATGDADGCEDSWYNACWGFLGASVTGDAKGAYAISVLGDAYGPFAFTPTGYCENAYEFYDFDREEYFTIERRARCVDAQVTEDADGFYAAASVLGDARGTVAVSGTGESSTAPGCAGYALYLLRSVTCWGDGGYATISGTGDARGNHSHIGASGAGEAEGGIVALSMTGPAQHNPTVPIGTAISVVGSASSCNYGNIFCSSASVLGPADGEVAVSVFGEAQGNVAASVFGHASGGTAVSACDAASELCLSPTP